MLLCFCIQLLQQAGYHSWNEPANRAIFRAQQSMFPRSGD